ncbi:MAG: choice-of-anchor D domain-containing protein [Flavobacterium sp.]|uniref:choice-of-anchor D domain-containing protein n=1 Tax=Flavobacterium sp. TaxID=239 RepID=UPI0032654564
MKIKLLFLTLLFSVFGWGQSIFTNPLTFASAVQSSPYTTGQTIDPNIAVSGISRGSGITGTAAANRYNANGWSTAGIDLNDYFEFTLTPNAGFRIDIANFVYTGQVSSGTPSFAFRSSIDGYTANIGTPTAAGTTINLVAGIYQNITTPITFRFYAFGLAAGTTTYSINDFTFNGTVTPSSPQPEINVTGNANNILTGDIIPSATDFTDFGNVNIASSLSSNFVVQNIGTANLNVTGATITGTNASDFVITTSPVGTIANGGNAGLTIQFTPTASGMRSATITIINNDSNEVSYTFSIQGNGICVPATVASIFPVSGPVGTEVTINSSSGSLLGSTVNFNSTAATIISSSASQLVVSVPAGATTGVINIVNTTTSCVISTPTFTIINKDITSCEGAAISDLIIYDIHDEKTGSGGFITLYNGTAATVNMVNYALYRTTTYGNGAEAIYATLTGTIASGALGILKVSPASCGPASTNGTITGGFNEDDGIQLRNAAGTVIIDDVHTYSTGPGYYMVRNAGTLSARTSYVAADWNTMPLGAGVCYPSAGLTIPSGGSSPSVSAQPIIALTCASTSATLSVTALEGFVGGNALAYQWYVVAPSTTTWTSLTNTGVYSGSTSAILNISSLTGLDGYQYYCQVREYTATCFIATTAVKISTGATIWNGSTWSDGLPTLSKSATINGNYTTSINGSFSACNLTINATFNLTVSANTYVEIQNNISNNGTFNILNTGSLIQINDLGLNTGNIFYERISSVKLQDYVYWSAPVTGTTIAGMFPTSPFRYSWATTTANANGGQGIWTAYSGNMVAGNGYIVRAPNGTSASVATSLTNSFNGVPQNGVFTPTVSRGTDFTGLGIQGIPRTITDDNWNLLGNPYPSAISINEFLETNKLVIDGFVKIWTHAQLPTSTTSPFYQDFVSNYYASDYISINKTGATSGAIGDYRIGSGQGFMVLMLPGLAGSSTVTFNNSMRSRMFANTQFFKTSNIKNTINNNGEQNRIWLDLVSPTETTRTLVGYVEGATQNKDNMYDAFTDYKSAQNFYSLIDNDPMTIQGRSLPFNDQDTVPMGIKTATNGAYTIAIAIVDGLFTDRTQKIYIEDKLLNTINDITTTPYQFTATQGITNDRFVLRYTNQTLSNTDFNLSENAVTVFVSNNEIKINSSLENIKDYTVYNVLGQKLAQKNNVNTNQSAVSTIVRNNQTLIIKVVLTNNQTLIKKIIF